MFKRLINLLGIGLLAAASILSAAAVDPQDRNGDDLDARGHHFIHRTGRELFHNGQRFRVAGTNNYYPMYSSKTMVDDLLTTAAASSFNVIRFWGFLDIGNQDGSNSVDGMHNGVYFHFFDGVQPAFNDGPTGLEHLDYVIYKAGQLDLKVIIPFVNNWNNFGGIDQYVRWRGGQFHDDFYTDPVIRTWYHDWVSHLLNHTNIFTGVKYKDDATILEWELANEPRCSAFSVYPASNSCNTQTLLSWADDASKFVKTIDKKHLLSMGDEGFFCNDATSSDFTENCSQGVDTVALANLEHIDAMSFHLYPDLWGKDAAWGTQWIERHIQAARQNHERVLLGEFGFLNKALRNPVYKQWTDEILEERGSGATYWLLSDKQDNGTLYPDFDGFTVYCPSPVCTAFTNFARRVEGRRPISSNPVADNDVATTQHDVPVTLQVTANDITYQNATLNLDSIDLDPSTPGQQTQFIASSGTFRLQSGGNVQFTPSPGFSGQASTPYTIKDSFGRTSTPANLVITVKGDPNSLFTFEDGVDGWASLHANTGTVVQSTNFPTDGTHSLQITGTDPNGDWFGTNFPSPVPSLANVHQILLDITTTSAGTAHSVALQVGNNFQWCQTNFGFINGNTSTTVTVDLASLFQSCGPPDTTTLRAIWVFFSGGGGVYHLDNVRTQ